MTDDITFGEPTVDRQGESTEYLWSSPVGDPIFRVRMEDTHEREGAIYSDITAWWLLDQPLGVRPVQPSTTLKLNSSHSTGWRSIPRELEKRIKGADIEGAMTTAVHDEMEHFRSGDEATLLGVTQHEGERPFVLDPFISSGGVTVMYGEGGLSKSLVALALGISVSTGVPIFGQDPTITGPVVYFDYEDDPRVHDIRLQAICKSFGINPTDTAIHHVPLVGKVTTMKRIMAKKAIATGAVLGILDSVGMGRGGSAVAAEDTIRMFRALRSVGIPFLAIDHVSKEAKGNGKQEVDAYGSIYTMNSARLAWYLSRTVSTNPDRIAMYAKNTKANHVRRQRSRVIEVEYVNNEKGVPDFINIEVSDDFGFVRESVPVRDRIILRMQDGEWWTPIALADAINVPSSTVYKAIARVMEDEGSRFEKRKVGKQTEYRSTGYGQDVGQ